MRIKDPGIEQASQATSGTNRCAITILTVIAVLLFAQTSAQAQRSSVPNSTYYAGFAEYYQADYRDAEKIFSRASNGALQAGGQRFLDSVCYMTMLGDCLLYTSDAADE